ncbi:hypothetical protein [Candidatus Carsonella ruddii]|uniref:Uncharacterized protein n=1 Tax=Candidatus Carsonella ruddii CE isolate Thao2000 TaxID=1202536 RepID=J7GYC5_CARRU|nr:hypothetical protein [Candidatus Carsonella ruddii]AFP83583.1 hypothetical protein A33U_0126 [Candidatus Carsonella ruddii CE isolate Thao2000]
MNLCLIIYSKKKFLIYLKIKMNKKKIILIIIKNNFILKYFNINNNFFYKNNIKNNFFEKNFIIINFNCLLLNIIHCLKHFFKKNHNSIIENILNDLF